MAINSDKSYDIGENGLGIVDQNGEFLTYITAGSGSPVGFAAPVPTIYIDSLTGEIWRKTGVANTAWVIANFDPNFGYRNIDFALCIPDNQEMMVSGITVEATGSLTIAENSAVRIV